MGTDPLQKPPAPDLPKYIREPLKSSSPERLDRIASFANDLAAWKRKQQQQKLETRRAEKEVGGDELGALGSRGVSTGLIDYDDVLDSGACISIKIMKTTDTSQYNYFYWQWREGDSWANEYISPVNPRE